MKMLSVSEAKDKLSSLIEEIEKTHEPVTITRHGKPAAVLMSQEDVDTVSRTIEWLSDPEHAAEMAEAEEDSRLGRMVPIEQVIEELSAR